MTSPTLSPRESDVLQIAGLGFTSNYIARTLHLSPRTVEVHIRHIYEKLGLTCRDELIEYALHHSHHPHPRTRQETP